MDKRKHERASAWCNTCGRRMTIVPNPYYRVGLATHEYFAVCDDCDEVEFVKHPTAHLMQPRSPEPRRDTGSRARRTKRRKRRGSDPA